MNHIMHGRHKWITVSLVAATVASSSALGAGPVRAATPAPAASAFVPFASCTRLLSYLRDQALPLVGPYGLSGATTALVAASGGVPRDAGASIVPAPVAVAPPITASAPATTAAPATVTASVIAAAPGAAPARITQIEVSAASGSGGGSSGTNTQEVGVDEGDLVENDGRHVYSVVDGRLRIVDTRAEGGAREIAGVALPSGAHQLLLDRSRLAVVTAFRDIGAETVASLYDVSNPAAPRLLNRSHLEGELVAARTVDHRARIVVRTSFGARLPFVVPTNPSDLDSLVAARNANRRVVQTAKAADWLPRTYRENTAGTKSAVRQALGCSEVGRPADTSGLAVTWVATLDLDVPGARADADGAAGVVGTGAIVYASERTLFVATNTAATGVPVPLPAPVVVGGGTGAASAAGAAVRQTSRPATRFHAFDLSAADGARYVASGLVDGTPLNQFSMSEHNGVVRIATTGTDPALGTTTESAIHLLQRNGRTYTEIGTLGGLGRTERIYAVRFLGDLGYVVTFRRTDPLYVVDLRDPRRPLLAGELKIPGYSAYLHPIGTGLLLGVGQDATEQGRITGTQLSLFDVNDPYTPTRVAQLKVGGASDAEYDHHAFLYWPATGSAVIPNVQNPFAIDPATGRRPAPFAGAVVAKVSPQAITEQGRVTHNPDVPEATAPNSPFVPVCPVGARCPGNALFPIQRSLIVDGQLVTVSTKGVKINGLDDLGDRGWVAFSS